MSGNHSNPPWSWSSQDPPPNDVNAGPFWSGHPGPPNHPGYGGYPYGFPPNVPPPPAPRMEGYGAYGDQGYGFNPSLPPPPFNCPPSQYPPSLTSGQGALREPSGPFNPMVGDRHDNPGPSNSQMYGHHPTTNRNPRQGNQHAYSTFGESEPPGFTYQHQQQEYRDLSEIHSAPVRSYQTLAAAQSKEPGQALSRTPLDESVIQRRQDEQWIRQFVQRRRKAAKKTPDFEQTASKPSPLRFREDLYGALKLVSKLSLACNTLKQNLEDDSGWADVYLQAQDTKKELQETLESLKGGDHLEGLKSKLLQISKRRARLRRRKQVKREELAQDRFADKEAAIDKWRMKRIQAVEEKKKERELKLAADSVLCEVRRKQADVKRMQDILRSLEKLRKLRKEAASRKGISPDADSEQGFGGRLERLRALIRTRTAVYGAEEKALRVMLEGEQEEERQRDLEERQRKERERQLQKKREVAVMLFGDEVPADPRQQPFREYYTQAERSLRALVQIRREWDMFLVPAGQAESSPVPQGWVLPEPPSDNAWASAMA
ncbi:programmed cell death protein 7 [Gadus chalcogrammus]|uniref:programmed cell death protein 7 n=1 Tax=Gadus chalcogrammus TaxID=1042646 RepID=UPI0024C4E216|nr:programmed cell death protein 7 [Gadus chalcogrammus]